MQASAEARIAALRGQIRRAGEEHWRLRLATFLGVTCLVGFWVARGAFLYGLHWGSPIPFAILTWMILAFRARATEPAKDADALVWPCVLVALGLGTGDDASGSKMR